MLSSWRLPFNLVSAFALVATTLIATMPASVLHADQQLTDFALQRLQSALESLKDQDRVELASLLQYVRIVVSNDEQISRNPRVDGKLMNLLANASSTPDYSIRIQGGWLLANLTTQNNVCGVVDTLFNPDLDIRARGNLLAIVAPMTNQMPSDVAAWLNAALAQPTGYQDTRAAEIKATLSSRLNAPETLNDGSPRDFDTCVELPNIASTYIGSLAENASYSVYIHTGKADPSDVEKVKSALLRAGFQVKGVDNDLDREGTGIDYPLKGPDPSLAHRKAAAIASIVNGTINRKVATRPQSLTPMSTFGVWL
ncbi:hypothetical protein PH547_20630 [Rhizobium sp. CNPSo 3464]|uniref:hypothetical protein n=1 Tax=Rhizobium sp. CNPSo 3464 TaxID=3021406 RepID=UPI002550352B|nr:hypothetical protein [Rhizobium sp. CNPSo 3464]MDK4741298.1 hypothetical protein [Rhizobium sp. CNPSo 3464]